MTVLTPAVKEFLAGPHVAALASVRPDGRPHLAPVWFEYDGREFVISAFRDTQKHKNLARKTSAALSIFTHDMPYRQVTVEGSVRIGGPLDNVWRERVAVRYLGERAGKAYAHDTAEIDMLAVHLRPTKWHIEGFE